MKKILIGILSIGLFNGCLIRDSHHDAYNGYSNAYYSEPIHSNRYNNYNYRGNYGDARMHVPKH